MNIDPCRRDETTRGRSPGRGVKQFATRDTFRGVHAKVGGQHQQCDFGPTPHHPEVIDLPAASSGVTDLRGRPDEHVGQVVPSDHGWP